MVTYKRSVDGVAPYTPNVYGLDTLATSDETWYDTMDETFQLGIDDNGLISAYCLDSFRATGDKKDNVDLISWDDALKKLPEAVNKYYTDNKTQYSTIEFNDVRLTYYKLKDGDKYTYSPVWVFAQCDKMEDGSLDKDYPQLQACSRLYTTEYQIRTIVTHSDTTQFRGRGLLDGLRVGVPLSSRHIAIPIDATVKGYVDMADLTERNIRQEGNRLTVILPDPRVELTATKVDHKQTRQFVRFLGRNFTDAERSFFERQGRDSIIASLPQSGIIENARASAARILVPLLTQMGYKEEDITITFRKEFTGDDLRHMITTITQEKRP